MPVLKEKVDGGWYVLRLRGEPDLDPEDREFATYQLREEGLKRFEKEGLLKDGTNIPQSVFWAAREAGELFTWASFMRKEEELLKKIELMKEELRRRGIEPVA